LPSLGNARQQCRACCDAATWRSGPLLSRIAFSFAEWLSAPNGQRPRENVFAFEREILMRKFLIATALLIGASAQAETYHVNGVTIHVPGGCSSTSCVSVAAPEYGYYHAGRRAKTHKERTVAKAAVSAKKDETAAAAPVAAPAAPAPVAADPAPALKADAPAAAAPEPVAK
jgi:hypothetical protein